jgi:hypothetical protein
VRHGGSSTGSSSFLLFFIFFFISGLFLVFSLSLQQIWGFGESTGLRFVLVIEAEVSWVVCLEAVVMVL